MDLSEMITVTASRWDLDGSGWSVIEDGDAATVRLPRAGVAVHLSRPGTTDARARARQAARARLAERDIPTVPLLATSTGATWERIAGRVVEVERWLPHEGRMNTWTRLRTGAELLAAVHDAWSDLDLGADGEACDWANWVAPTEVADNVGPAADLLRRWHLSALADDVDRLAELTCADVGLPEQVVHGDFWDDNVYVRSERLVAVTDFDFLGRRPRLDDLALMLYFADEQPFFDGVRHRSTETRISDLTPLVRAYARRLRPPITPAEVSALPVTLARQPLWTFCKRLLEDLDHDHARRDAVETAPAVRRALLIVEHPDPWLDAFSSAMISG